MIIAQVDCIVLRRRYPDARRGFRTPLYPISQVIGIGSCVWMIYAIHPDHAMRNRIWLFAGCILAAIVIYGIVWLKHKRMPLFERTSLAEQLEEIRRRSEEDEAAFGGGAAPEPAVAAETRT